MQQKWLKAYEKSINMVNIYIYSKIN